MDKIIIKGGRKLEGTVRISGSKNAALPILIATLLTDKKCVITNVPDLADIKTTIGFLTSIGKRITMKGSTVTAYSTGRLESTAPYDLVRKMRASVLVMGPLLGRLGKVKVSLPGGCAIGARPIDIHLESFKKLGAEITMASGYVEIAASKLSGAPVTLRFPSVGATENLLLACVLANGKTVIRNAAREPEIVDLAKALNAMGARITGAGTKTITVNGVKELGGLNHRVIPDRIEAATYLIGAGITRGSVTVSNADPTHIAIILKMMRKAGLEVNTSGDHIAVRWVRPLKPVSIMTAVYPGFPTDVQAQWMALMALVSGVTTVDETVFENRFMHVGELQRLGADIAIDGNRVIVRGRDHISGAPVMVSDLRAGAALVLAGLAAEGTTEVLRIYHLDRGYEHLEKKFRALGADIKRVPA